MATRLEIIQLQIWIQRQINERWENHHFYKEMLEKGDHSGTREQVVLEKLQNEAKIEALKHVLQHIKAEFKYNPEEK